MSEAETEVQRRETEELRNPAEKKSALDRWLKIGSAVVAFLTVAVGVYQYIATARNNFRKTVWAEQYALYQEATSAAAEIAMASRIQDVGETRSKFWHLYWGRLSILEHPNVKEAMVKYGNQLSVVEAGDAPPSSLRQLSYALARECRKSLEMTWNPVDLGDLGEAGK